MSSPWKSLAFDALRDPAFVVGRDGIVLETNAAAARWVGRALSEVIGAEFVLLRAPLASLHEHFLRLAARPVAETLEIESDGRVLNLVIEPLSPEEESAPFFCLLTDVTDRKRMLRELRARNEELAEAGRRKDIFLAMLSHELRTPVGAITSALHVLERRAHAESGDEARLREICRRQLDNLGRMLDDLLDVSRVTRGHVELRREPCDLAAAIFAAADALESTIAERSHRLVVDVPPHPVPVIGDPARLEQVFSNLLDNAAKFTPPGGHIEVRLLTEGSDALVRVRDDGIGLTRHHLRRVFDLFMTVDDDLEHGVDGLGLGLSLVRSLVHMHGGGVSARSAGPGRGSEFEVRLPIDASARGLLSAAPRARA